jgi:hypothetical protein
LTYEIKLFSGDKKSFKITVTKLTLIQMHVYNLILKDVTFFNNYCSNKDKLVKIKMKEIANKNLIDIFNICKSFKNNSVLPKTTESYPLESGKGFRYIRLSGYHRFVYRFINIDKELFIKKAMLYFDDDPPLILDTDTVIEKAIKDCLNIMFRMCSDVTLKFKNKIDKLPDYFDKLI